MAVKGRSTEGCSPLTRHVYVAYVWRWVSFLQLGLSDPYFKSKDQRRHRQRQVTSSLPSDVTTELLEALQSQLQALNIRASGQVPCRSDHQAIDSVAEHVDQVDRGRLLQCVEGPVSSISQPWHNVALIIELGVDHRCIHLQPCSQQLRKPQLLQFPTLLQHNDQVEFQGCSGRCPTRESGGQLLQGCWRAYDRDDSYHAGGGPSSNDVLQNFDQRAACAVVKALAHMFMRFPDRTRGTWHHAGCVVLHFTYV